MENDIPLKIEVLPDDSHLISSPNEIKSVMHFIAEKGNRVALYYNDADDFILTTILAVDSSAIWLEQSRNGSENRRVAESNKLIFVSSHLQIKVQFTVNQVGSMLYQGHAAFFIPLPGNIYRLQRREYYRLATLATEPLRCIINKHPAPNKIPLEFVIMDISCGGVGLVCVDKDTELTPGQSYPDCQIELPGLGKIKGAIEVMNLVLLTSRSGSTFKRAGCRFKDLDGATAILLQRYVTNMQRARTHILTK